VYYVHAKIDQNHKAEQKSDNLGSSQSNNEGNNKKPIGTT